MNEQALEKAVIASYWADPVLALRSLFPHWFPKKIEWYHRGIIALVLGRADFLLNFGTELYADEEAEWTEEGLDMIEKYFLHSLDPDDPDSKKVPLFYVRRDEAGRPTSVDLVISRYMETMLPRGFSKTTLFNALIILIGLFKVEEYVVYLSESATHAEMQLQNIKTEFESNEGIISLWGDLVPDRGDPEKWTGNDIQLLNGFRVQALGRGGQVRGKNSRGQRPGLILLDDVEDEESVATDEQRKKTLRWLMGAVMKALPKRRGRVYILGTLLHRESMMMNAARDPQWVVVRFGAMLPTGAALDAKFMTEKEWLAERESYKRQGLLDLFYMENQNEIHVDADNRVFKPEQWRTEIMTRPQFVSVAVAIDPAISSKKKSAAAAVGVVGMTTLGRLHVLDLYSKVGMTPREQIDKYFEMHFRWQCTAHGVESIAFQAALIHLLTEEMARKSAELNPLTQQPYGNDAYFAITPITHSQDKEGRIRGILAPRYASGYITHQRRFADLESEAIDFPNGKLDNLDVIAMAISLLDPVATYAAPVETHTLPSSLVREIDDAHQACP